MKKLSIKLFMMVLLATTVSFTACTNGTKTEKTDKQGKEYTSKYICPMHCAGSGGDEMGQCPVCGMDYVENKNFKDDESHDGHNH